MAHGEQAAREAYLAAGSQFGFADPELKVETTSSIRNIAAEAVAVYPEVTLDASLLDGDGLWIVHLLAQSGLCKTNSDARRLVTGNAVKINGEKVTELEKMLKKEDVPEMELLLQSGKKNFKKVIFK